VRARCQSRLAFALLLGSSLALTSSARAHDGFPEARQILLPPNRPEQVILVTNFGLLFSEDGGKDWLYSCERGLSAYASPYLLGAPPSPRIVAMSAAGAIYSDDESCTWSPTGASDVLPYGLALDPSDAQRVYVIGVPRDDASATERIYVSEDAGHTFGAPSFVAPAESAVLTVMAAPSRPSTVFAAMFSGSDGHPVLLRSRDWGHTWGVVADLVESLGQSPFELLAIDATDENRLFVRILEASAETLAISEDGGQTFVRLLSIPGKLAAFLPLASGTILLGGTAGTDPVGYRSSDGARSFQPWPEAPRIHALAERDGKLYVAADNFLDGYAIAESEDEGVHLTPLVSFERVRSIKSCVAESCAESCAYYADINLWPRTVCGPDDLESEPNTPTEADGDDDLYDDGDGGHAHGDGGGDGSVADGGHDAGNAAESGVEDSQPARSAGLRPQGGCNCTWGGQHPAGMSVVLFAAACLALMRRRREPRAIENAS
jgi:hypothetical protein